MRENVIELRFAEFDEVSINKKEAVRYMGVRARKLPEQLEELYGECLALLKQTVTYKACIRKTPLKLLGGGRIDLGFDVFESVSLEKNLTGCRSAYIFAATAGIGVDRLIARVQRTQPSKGLVLDAAASAAVEGWCDKINDEIKENSLTRPRFSPGYGDLPLEKQRVILDWLDAYRKIGITLSDNLLMLPIKSVTAIIGEE